jgi:hypothetical protein
MPARASTSTEAYASVEGYLCHIVVDIVHCFGMFMLHELGVRLNRLGVHVRPMSARHVTPGSDILLGSIKS